MLAGLLLALAGTLPIASGHISIWHPSMYGFNVTQQTFPYDNRPVAPLTNFTFDQWWFHGHLDYPPNPGDIFELPAGQPATTELACNKGLTSFWASSEGHTDIEDGNNPCTDPSGAFPSGAMHTLGENDLTGCALAIAYESDVTKIQPENFTVFSVNQTCVWNRFTDFQVPERMPPCPEGGCHCAWFWIHSPDSGGEQNYMNGFKCNVTGSSSDVALAAPQVPRRCGADPNFDKADAAPGNCTYGAKQPFYWFQAERNNMFEGTYAPPFYTDLYNFKDGAQDDIFADSYPSGLPVPSANSTFVPTPYLGPNSPVAGNSTASSAVNSPPATTSSVDTTSSASSPPVTSSVSPVSSGVTTSNAAATSPAPVTSAAPTSNPVPESTSLASTSAANTVSASSSAPFSTSSAAQTEPVTPPESTAITVTTSTSVILSTVVVTVTAAPTSTDTPASAAPSSVISSSVSSDAQSESVAASPTSSSSVFMATQAPSQTSAVAGSTIVLNALPASASSSVPNGAILVDTIGQRQAKSSKPVMLAADANSSAQVCKREVGQRKILRRRTTALPKQTMTVEDSEKPSDSSASFVARTLGLSRHRKMHKRSRLWHLF